ncbi:hypothetical protein M758_9G099200 [Ceratodon purpureus]|nr:hypothetical protein M758_9G099200 [Ceratodon purpureus]
MDMLRLLPRVVTEWIHGGQILVTACSVMVALLSFTMVLARFGPRLKFPPGPKGLPIVGNLLQMGARPHRAMTAMHKKYGHIVYLRLGCVPTVFVDSPALIAEVTKEQDSVFSSRPHMTFTDIVAYDAHDFAMAPYGPHWRHVRRICVNELLTPKRLASTARERTEESACMIGAVSEAAQKGEVVDMRDVFAGVSMTVMCRMLLGRREFAATGQKPKDFKHLIHELFRLMGALNLRDFVPCLGWLDLQGFERDMYKLRNEIDEVLDAVIQEHRDLASGKRPGGKPNDFVSVLLDLPGENGALHLKDDTMKAIIIDMMAGATDTSAVTNEWAMAEIIRSPRIQRKLQEEIDNVVGRDRNVTEADVSEFPYLMCVVKETFRLHPAGPFAIPRETMADTTLNGYHIPKGTRVLINIFSLGRSAETWTEPLKFQPERWENENLSAIHDPGFRILPFGYGRRQCPGYNLGTTMVLLTLARLLHAFEWRFPSGVTADSLDMEELYGCTSPLRTRLRAIAIPRLAPHLYAQ